MINRIVDMSNINKCPDHSLISELDEWFNMGLIDPNSFFCSVITNNLQISCMRADDHNRVRLWDWMIWLYIHAPVRSWGSLDILTSWPVYISAWQEDKFQETLQNGAANAREG